MKFQILVPCITLFVTLASFVAVTIADTAASKSGEMLSQEPGDLNPQPLPPIAPEEFA